MHYRTSTYQEGEFRIVDFSEDQKNAVPLQTVLFLCSGNYYRSRFAEIFFNWHARQQGMPWRADSRGLRLDPLNLGHMSHYTVRRLTDLGISSSNYQRNPQDLDLAALQTAHHIVAVKEIEHRPLLTSRFPQWLNNVEFWQVHDIDCSDPSVALPHLEREVLGLLDRLRTVRTRDLGKAG
jgi:protein-tyrosine phosphatase